MGGGFGRPGRNGPSSYGQGPIAGIDRGLAAQLDPTRGRPRKTVDASSLYSNILEQRPFVRDYRDEVHLEPHSMSVPQVCLSAGGPHVTWERHNVHATKTPASLPAAPPLVCADAAPP